MPTRHALLALLALALVGALAQTTCRCRTETFANCPVPLPGVPHRCATAQCTGLVCAPDGEDNCLLTNQSYFYATGPPAAGDETVPCELRPFDNVPIPAWSYTTPAPTLPPLPASVTALVTASGITAAQFNAAINNAKFKADLQDSLVADLPLAGTLGVLSATATDTPPFRRRLLQTGTTTTLTIRIGALSNNSATLVAEYFNNGGTNSRGAAACEQALQYAYNAPAAAVQDASVPQPPSVPVRPVQFRNIAGGLGQPVAVAKTNVPGDKRLFVVIRTGIIYIMYPNGTVLADQFLNIVSLTVTSGELGLLGLAFHPNYQSNRYFFIHHSRKTDGATMIVRYQTLASNPNKADNTSATVVLAELQPYGTNHKGGAIEFGNDGMLYIGLGDGGGADDPNCNAQKPNTNLLGKLLRINVDSLPYTIPNDNPFANGLAGKPEVFLYGLRNPWKFTVDRFSGDLWIADVGQGTREEVDVLRYEIYDRSKINLGWRIMEGFMCYLSCPGINVTCSSPSLLLPVLDYTHAEGCSITGGYLYRGSALAGLFGKYIFGDFCQSRVWYMDNRDPGAAATKTSLGVVPGNLYAFGEDDDNELYAVGNTNIYKLVPA